MDYLTYTAAHQRRADLRTSARRTRSAHVCAATRRRNRLG